MQLNILYVYLFSLDNSQQNKVWDAFVIRYSSFFERKINKYDKQFIQISVSYLVLFY